LKVILTRDYEKLGNAGDVINVKDGFAKNFLIPNNIALVATQGNLNQMEIVKKSLIKKEAKSIGEAKNIASIIDGMTITLKVNSSPEGRLFGSITTKDLAEKILELKKVELDKKKIDLEEHIKEVGSYEVIVHLYKEIKAAIKLEVTSDDVVVQEVQKEAETEETPGEV